MDFSVAEQHVLAALKENSEMTRLMVRTAQIKADDEWIANHLAKKAIEISLPELEKDGSAEAKNFLALVRASKTNGTWDKIDSEYIRAEPVESYGTPVARTSFFGMSLFHFIETVFKGVQLGESNPDWVAFEKHVLIDQLQLDVDDRIDVADLDTLSALYQRLNDTEAIAMAYESAPRSRSNTKNTSLVLRIYEDCSKANLMKRGADNIKDTEKFTNFVLNEVRQNWPDEIVYSAISRIVRYLQNTIMYLSFCEDKEKFCSYLSEISSKLGDKSNRLFLHIPTLTTVIQPSQVDKINGSDGANWFGGLASNISRRDFYKIKFNNNYVEFIAERINDDKSKIIANTAMLYIKICREIACYANNKMAHYQLKKFFTKKNVDEWMYAEKFNTCITNISDSILSYDARVGVNFSVYSAGNIGNIIKTSFRKSAYDKNKKESDFDVILDSVNQDDAFTTSNSIIFNDPKDIIERNERYKFLINIIDRSNLDVFCDFIVRRKFSIGYAQGDDNISDEAIAEELSKDPEMVKRYGTKSGDSEEMKISRQKVNRGLGKALEKM